MPAAAADYARVFYCRLKYLAATVSIFYTVTRNKKTSSPQCWHYAAVRASRLELDQCKRPKRRKQNKIIITIPSTVCMGLYIPCFCTGIFSMFSLAH